MNADQNFMAGFAAALDLAERTGAAILAGQWGHPIRREHAAAGLLQLADAAREAFGNNVGVQETSATGGMVLGAIFMKAPADSQAIARLHGYIGEACPDCANFTLVRNGTCLKCDTCGSTTGCS